MSFAASGPGSRFLHLSHNTVAAFGLVSGGPSVRQTNFVLHFGQVRIVVAIYESLRHNFRAGGLNVGHERFSRVRLNVRQLAFGHAPRYSEHAITFDLWQPNPTHSPAAQPLGDR
jgi:hypothetical protein